MKKVLFAVMIVVLTCVLAVTVFATTPAKPDIGVEFGTVQYIDGFTPPSELFVNTDERVLLTDGNGNYVTYPTYYITKDQTKFEFDFSKINTDGRNYSKASVVMLEIPEGITEIAKSYFAGTGNFPKCVYVQFPGTVTTYGESLFAGKNDVIKMVEFLDGTEPITMGNAMFGSQWNGGTGSLVYVKFPNNLVSIGTSTFGKSNNLRTVIFGEKLATLGESFFSQGFTGPYKNLYVGESYFKNTDAIQSNAFGELGQYNERNVNIVMFTPASKELVNSYIEAGKSVQSGYIWDKAKVYDVSEYSESMNPSGFGNLVVVCGYNKCDAFYNGQHNLSDIPTMSFAGEEFLSSLTVKTGCDRNCGNETVIDTLAPLFVDRGFAYGPNSMLQGVAVDRELLDEYGNYFTGIKYGLVAAAKSAQASASIIDANGVGANGYVAAVDYTERDYDLFEMNLYGISEDYQATEFYFGAYVIADGQVYYIHNGTTNNEAQAITYNDVVVIVDALIPENKEDGDNA